MRLDGQKYEYAGKGKGFVHVPETMVLSPDLLILTHHSEGDINVIFSPSGEDYGTVSWTSAVPETVPVSSDTGHVAALAVTGDEGVTITEEIKEPVYRKAECRVIVKPLPVGSISLSENSLSLTEGGTHRLTAAVSPKNATNTELAWESGNISAAKVDQNGNVSAVGVGESVIMAVAKDGGGALAECRIKVLPAPITVSEIVVTPEKAKIQTGTVQRLKAEIYPVEATSRDVKWSVKSGTSATVDNEGLVTADGGITGDTIITAEDGGISKEAVITVTPRPSVADTVSLNMNTLSLYIGQSALLTANVTPVTISDKSVLWSKRGDGGVLEDVDGRTPELTVSAMKAGTAVVMAERDGKIAECVVTVLEKPVRAVSVEGLTLSQNKLAIDTSTTAEITANVVPANASGTLTWSLTNKEAAQCEAGGGGEVVVKAGVSEGDTALIAKFTDAAGKTVSATCNITVKDHREPVKAEFKDDDRTATDTVAVFTAHSTMVEEEIGSESVKKQLEAADDGTKKLP
ncbi:MAG: Ig-like domain-containing protein [Synergistaceae bacterium]|nr:Ig-like domain-containing protein [Synergistaceae bacterium]